MGDLFKQKKTPHNIKNNINKLKYIRIKKLYFKRSYQSEKMKSNKNILEYIFKTKPLS